MNKDPWFRNCLIRKAAYQATHEAMARNPAIYLMGEGSHMKIHFDAPDIERDFGDRVMTLPISEDANANFAVGASLAGVVPVVDVISSDFLYRCMDGVCNTMAKAGCISWPRTMIVRAEFLVGGPTAGQRVEALFAHVPGLRVTIPSNPADAYSLMHEALAYPGVTVFFEDRMIEDGTMPEAYKPLRRTPSGARVAFEGSRCTVVSYGLTCRIAEEALRDQDCTVIDLKTLWPLDMETICKSVVETNRLLVVEPDVKFLGIGAEIVAQVAEAWPGTFCARLGAPRVTIPASRELHDNIMPSATQIVNAVSDLEKEASL